jgi:hypothetical protein
MLHVSRSTRALFLVLALLVALHGWLRMAEQGRYSPPPVVTRFLLWEPLRQREAVLADLEAARELCRITNELAMAVADGRLTLWEGAARLRDTYRAASNLPWAHIERRFPGMSDEERCCRLLIGEVRALGGPVRERAQAVAAHLEAQLDKELERGPLSLPR